MIHQCYILFSDHKLPKTSQKGNITLNTEHEYNAILLNNFKLLPNESVPQSQKVISRTANLTQTQSLLHMCLVLRCTNREINWPAIWWEADTVDRLVEVEMMQHSSCNQAHQNCSSIYKTHQPHVYCCSCSCFQSFVDMYLNKTTYKTTLHI